MLLLLLWWKLGLFSYFSYLSTLARWTWLLLWLDWSLFPVCPCPCSYLRPSRPPSPIPSPVPRPVPRPVISPVPHHRPCMVTAGLVCHDLNQYRSQNGECNNLKNPRWGAAMTAFKRLLPNSYQNKISLPRYLKVITFQNYIFRLTNK